MQDFYKIISHLLTPAKLFFDASARIYWSYLVFSLLISFVVLYYQLIVKRKKKFTRIFYHLFYKRLFLHPSSIVDYKYFIINTILFSVVFSYSILSAITVIRWVNNTMVEYFGYSTVHLEPSLVYHLLFTLLLWLSHDFGRFLAHYLLHRNSYLWEFHKFHHSAEALNPITDYRAHPVEGILLSTFASVFSGLTGGLLLYFLPTVSKEIIYWDVNIGILFFNLYANLRHSQLWLPFPKWLSYILLSPTQHQIHHSNLTEHFNKNYGVCFSFWDSMFGTLIIPETKLRIKYGLEGNESKEDFSTIHKIYWKPFYKILRNPTVSVLEK